MIALLSVSAKAKPHGQGSAVSQATNYGGECLFLTEGGGRGAGGKMSSRRRWCRPAPASARPGNGLLFYLIKTLSVLNPALQSPIR